MRWPRRSAPVSPSSDPVVADAHFRQAEAERQLLHAQAQRPRVDARRREAAELLEVSRESERRNHFAEAIVKSMGRKQ